MSQIPIDNLDAGDDSPKLARVSLKDAVEAINRISYTFKTPDAMVAPDALQLGDDGNLALGNVPLVYSAVGRNFRVNNPAAGGGAAANATINIESNSGAAFINLVTTNGLSGFSHWDGTNTTTPSVHQSWSQQNQLWRLRMYNGSVQSTALKANPAGQVGIGENAVLQANLNVGAVGSTTINEIYVASNTTNFEGAFLGAYDATSGAKLDLNTQANATNVSSWRMSHDTNVNGQGRLSFSLAPATTTRAGLTYAERFALLNNNVLIGGGAARSVGGQVRYVQIEHAGLANISMVTNTNDVNGSNISFAKTRGTSKGSSTIVQDGDGVGGLQWVGANGTDLSKTLATITGFVSGTVTSTSIPGTLIFSTTKVGDSGVSEALRITNQQNIAIGGASDVAKLVIIKGVTYPTGENLIYLQSSSPSTVPVMITGSSSGTTSISGGAALASGGARGGQIDLIGGGALTRPGNVIIRTGTNADGQPGSNAFTYNAAGFFGVNTLLPLHRIYAVGNTAERIRVMMDTFAEYSGFTGRRANGTAAAPTKVLANDGLVFLNAHGYTGTQYTNGGQITIQAESDWSDTSTASTIVLAPGTTGALGQVARMVVTSAGKVGINALSPVSIFNVTSPLAPAAVGFEVDPDNTNGFVQLRSYDRTASNYKGWAQAASQFLWGIGVSTASTLMALTSSGNLAVGGTLARGGSGITAIEGNIIIQAATSTTALTVQNGENYSGFKIKVGPTTQANGGPDYYDFTTRPGAAGVGSNGDYTMIRLESALSKSNPDMYLQTSGAGGRVVIGNDVPTSPARLNVVAFTTGSNILSLSGNATTSANADMIISRSGAVSSQLAGRGSSIQLTNGTNGSHVLLQENDNGLQIFNYATGAWGERMYMANTGRFTFGAHSSAASAGAETVQVIGGLSGGNEYCYFAQANTGNQAYAMRMFSTTANTLVGSISFTGSSTAFNTTSDRRLKENIVESPFASDILRSIAVRSFNFINSGEFFKYGFVAQELVNSAPWAVTQGSGEDAVMDGLNGIWAVDNSKLVPLVVKSQQEVIDELRDTKVQLEDARSRILSLEQTMTQVLLQLEELKKAKTA